MQLNTDTLIQQKDTNYYTLSKSTGNGITTTQMETWSVSFNELVEVFSQPCVIANKMDAAYFLRADSTARNDRQTADTAFALILDGDKHISANGEAIEGAPPFDDVAIALELSDIPFIAHTTFSNTIELPRYRFIIPCDYEREHLEPLLNSLFEILHSHGVMLANVKENNVWAKAWFMPSVGDKQALELFEFRCFEGKEAANV